MNEPPANPAPGAADAPRRLVIAEPSPMVGKILRDKLVREGYDVDWIAEPASAAASLRERPPDLLIVNAMLPDEDGVEILASLPRETGRLRYPVILTFEKALYPEEEERLASLGASALIPLPFKPTEVARVVKRLLETPA